MTLYRDPESASTVDHANAAIAFAGLREAQRNLLLARELWCEAREVYACFDIDLGVEMCRDRIRALKKMVKNDA